MRNVLAERARQGLSLVVGHVVLLAEGLDNWLQVAVVAVVDAGEQVVLNLIVEATSEDEGQVAVDTKRVAGDGL